MFTGDKATSSPIVVPPASSNEAAGQWKQGAVLEDKHNLLSSVLIPPHLQHGFEVLRVKRVDNHGHIYQARAGTTLYEIRVYSFSQKDASERKQAKRNCREWKARRRFLVSWKQNDLVCLILRSQKDNTTARTVHDWNPKTPIWSSIPWSVGFDDDVKLDEDISVSQAEKSRRATAKVQFGSRSALEHGANIRTKTNSQKERNRKLQHKRRRVKRAGRRALKSVSHNPEELTSRYLYPPTSPYYPMRPKPPEFAAYSDSYWSPDGGWGEEVVYGANRSSRYETVYSIYGGWFPGYSLHPTVPTNMLQAYNTSLGQTMDSYQDLHSGRSAYTASRKLEEKASVEKEEAEKDSAPAKSLTPISSLPSGLPKMEKVATSALPKKHGSANLTHHTLSTLVKMVL